MKLFYAPQSPFARKVRAAAIELGLDAHIEVEYVEVVPGKPNRVFGDLYNPLRKVPALLTDHGEAIFDSTVVCEYLDDLAGGGFLIPRTSPARWHVLTNHALAQGICESVVLIRYETLLRPQACQSASWLEDQQDKVRAGLRWFEHNPGALQDPLNLAHLALGSAIGYLNFRWPQDDWWKPDERVREWFERLDQRPSFSRTRPTAHADA